MKDGLTPNQMINAELATRAGNKKSVKKLKQYVPRREQKGLKIAFLCECSDPDCTTRVHLTLEEYEELHKNFARFVVAKGHDEPKIERITNSNPALAVVEKYALPKS